jgi:uncharacterized protein
MIKKVQSTAAKSAPKGMWVNSGDGPVFQPIDIGHSDYMAVIDPDSAFWSLVLKEQLSSVFEQKSSFQKQYLKKRDNFIQEMNALRFNSQPLAVYFNPTERCNLDCVYCYLPQEQRREGVHMSRARMHDAMKRLKDYFVQTLPRNTQPRIIFHGAEPMLVREAVFDVIENYGDYFHFGIQTNGTLLDDEAIQFIKDHRVGLGLSLDGHIGDVANRTRMTWGGDGVFKAVSGVLEKLIGYDNYNVICTATNENMTALPQIVSYLHGLQVPVAMLNPVRCTRQGARDVKPLDRDLSKHYLKALDRSFTLFEKTNRKLVIANFANILISIMAPAARILMCDISPCGGGRCFFAVSAAGDMFPCSEFLGVGEFKGGNLFKHTIDKVLHSEAFQKVTSRKVEDITPCSHCAIRHFCGAPCPAEAYEMNGGMRKIGAFCELYEEQLRYAMRLIADEKAEAFLWDGWDHDTKMSIDIKTLS